MLFLWCILCNVSYEIFYDTKEIHSICVNIRRRDGFNKNVTKFRGMLKNFLVRVNLVSASNLRIFAVNTYNICYILERDIISCQFIVKPCVVFILFYTSNTFFPLNDISCKYRLNLKAC